MDPATLFLSTTGRLTPRPFAIGALLIYAASLASQALISAPLVARAGFWPFAAVQATLLWGWYALHAKRLRDAGEDIGPAAGVAALYAVAMVLLLFVAFFIRVGARPPDELAGPTLRWLGPLSFGFFGRGEFGGLGLILAAFVIAAFVPALVALAFSIWTGTRPTAAAASP
jgi:uncharacterized membrane protein YhaH (DUF805 family)